MSLWDDYRNEYDPDEEPKPVICDYCGEEITNGIRMRLKQLE
jgi:hypothetical protein